MIKRVSMSEFRCYFRINNPRHQFVYNILENVDIEVPTYERLCLLYRHLQSTRKRHLEESGR